MSPLFTFSTITAICARDADIEKVGSVRGVRSRRQGSEDLNTGTCFETIRPPVLTLYACHHYWLLIYCRSTNGSQGFFLELVSPQNQPTPHKFSQKSTSAPVIVSTYPQSLKRGDNQS
ncbi:hypothetical protein BV22DRAFT_787940 [Leucogyrophana mollusca]|uniref:Uncharacterized protein n=1 Tax=Leucogyrophana mollusca TaxID=85980 RepID=A0ACB8B5W1_9AGAM|nr:hypothetical protein BV22DRAFT_787940 [Leucogyrophana mollusca]